MKKTENKNCFTRSMSFSSLAARLLNELSINVDVKIVQDTMSQYFIQSLQISSIEVYGLQE